MNAIRPSSLGLALLLLAPIATDALAQVPQPSPASPAPIVAPNAPTPLVRSADFGPWWRDSELALEIDLGDETIDNLERLFLEHRLRLAELAAQLDRARAAVDYQRHREPKDAKKVRNAEDELFGIRSELESARAELQVEVRALLTSEQWQQLSGFHRRHQTSDQMTRRMEMLRLLQAQQREREERGGHQAIDESTHQALVRFLRAQRREREEQEGQTSPLRGLTGPSPLRGLTGPSSPVAPAPPHVPSPRPEIAPRALTIPAAPAPLPRPPAAPAPLPRPSAAPAPFPRPPAPPALSWWTDTSIRSELGLDTRQVQALERITSDVAPRLLNLLRRFTAKEGELSRLVAAETLDRDAARLQIERLAEALRALRATSRTLEQDLLEVLTPEQRQNLQERSPFRRQETP